MAILYGKEMTREEILSRVGDIHQLAQARLALLSEGKGAGTQTISINTGSGLRLSVLPGRGMDIAESFYQGIPFHFATATGITSPAYYEEPGLGWLRSFFGGLLTTCGITNAGIPSRDEGRDYGLHGRVSNSAAEDVGISQRWEADQYLISVYGKVREASAMFENLELRRTIHTGLGWKRFILEDVIANNGFEPQPLMMIYHINLGYPFLDSKTRVCGPILDTESGNEESKTKLSDCLTFSDPVKGAGEMIYFHRLATDQAGRTFIAAINRAVGDRVPLGVVLRFQPKELPCLTHWKLPRKGYYVMGLEPGTVTPAGRAVLRDRGELPYLEGQENRRIRIEFEVVDSLEEINTLEKDAAALVESHS